MQNNPWNLKPRVIHKNQPQIDERPNYKGYNEKLLEENTGENMISINLDIYPDVGLLDHMIVLF